MSSFRVNTTGFSTRPCSYSCSGSFVFAEAKTSAGAPCWICAASMFEPENEYRSCDAICGKTFVSDAAAKTVRTALAITARPSPTWT